MSFQVRGLGLYRRADAPSAEAASEPDLDADGGGLFAGLLNLNLKPYL